MTFPSPSPAGEADLNHRPIVRTLRVVHVVESFGGGVAAAVNDYVQNAPEAQHQLLFATRADAPVDLRDLECFDSAVELPRGHFARLRAIRSALRDANHSVVAHAHSSYGGVYARLAATGLSHVRVVYTPHCFAFERRDIGWPARAGYRAAEYALAPLTDCFAACSPREAALARRLTASVDVVFVPNIAPPDVPRQDRSALATSHRAPLMVGAGRLGPQKDPLFFRDAVVSLRRAGIDVRAKWVGGGDLQLTRLLEESQIEVTGWLRRESVFAELGRADLYVHSARWEGFPVAILEVAALGVPIVVRDISAFESIPFHATLHSPEDLRNIWPDLQTHASLRSFDLCNETLLREFSRDEQEEALKAAYQIGFSR